MITAKLNVVKIDKTKLFEGKNGAKYLDIVLIETPNDEYGNDYMIVQGTSKEERDKGIKGAILGNAKIFVRRSQEKNAPKPVKEDDDDQSVPF